MPRTSFVGRTADLAKVAHLLAEHRLVTVTGPGGVGKTRLAGAAAQEVAGRFADGVWVAELAATLDPELVPGVVAEALGLQLAPGVGVADVLVRRQLLLVLDNCEHVLDAAAGMCESILASADDVRVLATSREPLGVAGESRFRLGPLRLPEPDGDGPGDTIADAVTLFADRARLADSGFVADGESARLLAQIVTRLDGMPLAIELAAARVESLGLAQLAARLDDRLRLLTGSGRTASGRHSSLAAAADWSYRLLDEEQQRVFRALSVFPGPFTLEAAEVVAGPVAGMTVLRLVDCSLVTPPRTSPDGLTRYVMLETLRAFGSERLADAGEQHAVQAALARYAVDLAETTALGLQTSTGEVAALSTLDAELATLQQALAWALDNDSGLALRLAVSLAYWWEVRCRWVEGYGLLSQAARHAVAGTEQWCTAQFWLGYLSSEINVSTCLTHLNAVIGASTKHLVQVPFLAQAHAGRAIGLANLGQPADAADEARLALDLAVQLGDPFGEAFALFSLGYTAYRTGGPGAALAWFRRTQNIDLAAAPGWISRQCVMFLADVLGETGEIAEARLRCAQALTLARQAGSLNQEGNCLGVMASLDLSDGELGSAGVALRQAIGLYERNGGLILLYNLLQGCVDLTGRSGRWRETVTLWAAWDAVNKIGLHFVQRPDNATAVTAETARAALGAAEARAAEERGAAMTPDAAAAYALEVLADEPNERAAAEPAGRPALSARERELVLLVAQGRTDAQIAGQLFISIRTVRSHLDRIRDKTGCRRRADLTRLALQAGLI